MKHASLLRRVGATLFVFGLICAQAMAEDCRLQMVASTPLQKSRLFSHVSAPVSINGHTLRLIVDTGSPSSILTDKAADVLSLKREALVDSFKMLGGDEARESTRISDLRIGDAVMRETAFIIMRTDRFNFGGEQFDGLIGADLLSRFDADFDFSGNRLTLYQPHPCDGHEVSWPGRKTAITKLPFTGQNGRIILPVELDGKPLIAILDTGASESSIALKMAEGKLGLSPGSAAMVRLSPPAEPDPIYAFTFKEIRIGSVRLPTAQFQLISFERAHWFFSSLLGMPELRRLHLYIAYKEHMLYISPEEKK